MKRQWVENSPAGMIDDYRSSYQECIKFFYKFMCNRSFNFIVTTGLVIGVKLNHNFLGMAMSKFLIMNPTEIKMML